VDSTGEWNHSLLGEIHNIKARIRLTDGETSTASAPEFVAAAIGGIAVGSADAAAIDRLWSDTLSIATDAARTPRPGQ